MIEWLEDGGVADDCEQGEDKRRTRNLICGRASTLEAWLDAVLPDDAERYARDAGDRVLDLTRTQKLSYKGGGADSAHLKPEQENEHVR